MNTSAIHYKLFVGCKLTPDLKRHLEKNSGWKETPLGLKEVYHQNQNYLGIHLPEKHISLAQLQAFEKEIEIVLLPYCPEMNRDKFKVYVFPQLFIS